MVKVVRCKIGKITCFVDDARIFAHRKECTVEEKMHARKSEALAILCHLILFVLFVIVIIIVIIIYLCFEGNFEEVELNISFFSWHISLFLSEYFSLFPKICTS